MRAICGRRYTGQLRRTRGVKGEHFIYEVGGMSRERLEVRKALGWQKQP